MLSDRAIPWRLSLPGKTALRHRRGGALLIVLVATVAITLAASMARYAAAVAMAQSETRRASVETSLIGAACLVQVERSASELLLQAETPGEADSLWQALTIETISLDPRCDVTVRPFGARLDVMRVPVEVIAAALADLGIAGSQSLAQRLVSVRRAMGSDDAELRAIASDEELRAQLMSMIAAEEPVAAIQTVLGVGEGPAWIPALPMSLSAETRALLSDTVALPAAWSLSLTVNADAWATSPPSAKSGRRATISARLLREGTSVVAVGRRFGHATRMSATQ